MVEMIRGRRGTYKYMLDSNGYLEITVRTGHYTVDLLGSIIDEIAGSVLLPMAEKINEIHIYRTTSGYCGAYDKGAE